MATAMRRALLSSRPSLSPLCALRLARPGARVGLGSARGCATTSPKIAALVDQIAELSLLEAAQLTDALKERLGISSAMLAPAGAVAPAGAGAAPAAEAEEAPAAEKTHFTVKLDKFDAASKIKLIKEVRAITGLGLKEAKELVEGAPKDIKVDVKKEEAEELKAKLEAAGGVIVVE